MVILNNYLINSNNISNCTVLQFCESVGYSVLRFCFHRKLHISGNCRICLCLIERERKPSPACATMLREGISINFVSDSAKKLREDVLMFILYNHPLDCPVCDQGGDCELQDIVNTNGINKSRYFYFKHSVENKNCGPIIKTVMSRCIHCTRCIRFLNDVAGFSAWGAVGRGSHMEIGNYINSLLSSEVSGNIVDLCPVGALTFKSYAFESRPWDLVSKTTLDFSDGFGCFMVVSIRGSFVYKVLPNVQDDLNEDWLSDKARFFFDGIYVQRIIFPLKRMYGNNFHIVSWEFILWYISLNFIRVGAYFSKNCGIFLSNLLDCDSLFSIKQFFTKLGYCNFYNDIKKNDFVNFYSLNLTPQNLKLCDFCYAIGCFCKYEASILNLKLRKLVLDNNMLFIYQGAVNFCNFPMYYVGSDISCFLKFCEGTSFISKKLINSQFSILLFNSLLFSLTFFFNCFIFLHDLFKKFNKNVKLCVLTNFANYVGKQHINFITKNSLNFKKIKSVFLFNLQNNELNSLNILSKKTFKVYFGSIFNKIAVGSDMVIPVASVLERDGFVINCEGNLRFFKKCFKTIGLNRFECQFLYNLALYARLPNGFFFKLDNLHKIVLKQLGNSLNISGYLFFNLKNLYLHFNILTKIYTSYLIPTFFKFYLTSDIFENSNVMLLCNNLFDLNYNFKNSFISLNYNL